MSLKRHQWLTPRVPSYGRRPNCWKSAHSFQPMFGPMSKHDMCLSWSRLWLTSSVEGGQITAMFELPEDLGRVGGDARSEQEEPVQDCGWGLKCHVGAGWTVWIPTGWKPIFSQFMTLFSSWSPCFRSCPLKNINGITVTLLLKILQWLPSP